MRLKQYSVVALWLYPTNERKQLNMINIKAGSILILILIYLECKDNNNLSIYQFNAESNTQRTHNEDSLQFSHDPLKIL